MSNKKWFVLMEYKKLLCRKRTEYYNSKISELEESTKDPDKKRFWQCLKSMDDTQKDKDDHPLVSEETGLTTSILFTQINL